MKSWRFEQARNSHHRSVHTFLKLINGAKNRNEARGEKTRHEKGKEYERK